MAQIVWLLFILGVLLPSLVHAFIYSQQSHSVAQTIINVSVWTTPTSVYGKCGEFIAHEATKTKDDNTGSDWWHFANERHWIIFDMGETKIITKVRVYQGAYKLLDVNCHVSNNPSDWGEAVFTDWDPPNPNAWNESPSFSKSGRYIKLSNIWTTYPLHYMYLTFYEFDAYVSP